ncbi:MAG TPA: sigma-70 family RNA polymerase sigma factor [Candidatus Dormibacteraeota bacterium]|nr:sigma-70 family RNA polymerase sigma factor [Candidatus Dormibacteraeota bacterium]
MTVLIDRNVAEAVQPNTGREAAATLETIAARMYAQHRADVFRYLRARVTTQAEAEDLTSDVFCKVVAGLKNYRTMRSSALPWLYTIAAHRVVDHYRAARPTSELDAVTQVADSAPNPADIVITRDLVREIWTLSRSLPAPQRRALWLRYGEELELREIAFLMGRSVEAVKLLVHRAVRGVRAELPTGAATPTLRLTSGGTSS